MTSSPTSTYSSSVFDPGWCDSCSPGYDMTANMDGNPNTAELLLPEAPEPAGFGGNPEREHVPWAADWVQPPFSRVGIGADINTLGLGIKGAIVLSRDFDARGDVNFLNYNTGRLEVEGFNVYGNVHLATAAASVDWYPFNSVWRISPGVMFFNGNKISVTTDIVPGTKFTLGKDNFYGAKANSVTGATPLEGTGVLGLNTNKPAFTIAGGFGKFIPRSNRHWSFPAEFGVAFTGAPTINVTPSGWACLDIQETECSNVGNPDNPVTIEFNSALQSTLTRWRKDLNRVQIYPLFSYSVVYSFNIK